MTCQNTNPEGKEKQTVRKSGRKRKRRRVDLRQLSVIGNKKSTVKERKLAVL